jgi:D-alanyl-D-alanine carboxypeptidase
MCGKHRKRPAAEEADDDTPAVTANAASGDPNSPTAFMLSSLAPSPSIKNSQLVAPPGPVNPIVVFTGPGKKSAQTQVAAARERLDKKNPKGAKSKQVVSADPTAAAAVAPAANQTISAAQPGSFGPPTDRFAPPAQGSRPTTGSNSFMSFAPAANAGPAPLTAMPAVPRQTAAVPMPRPRPKPKAN